MKKIEIKHFGWHAFPVNKNDRVVPNTFHARCVILKMSVYSLVIAREYGKGIRDASPEMKN